MITSCPSFSHEKRNHQVHCYFPANFLCVLTSSFSNLAKKMSRKLLSEKYRRKSKFGKNLKSNKNISCHVKRLSSKYGKKSKNNKFNKILQLQRKKVKSGFEKSTKFTKIAKVTRIFLAMWEVLVTNMAKIARITNLTKFYT